MTESRQSLKGGQKKKKEVGESVRGGVLESARWAEFKKVNWGRRTFSPAEAAEARVRSDERGRKGEKKSVMKERKKKKLKHTHTHTHRFPVRGCKVV